MIHTALCVLFILVCIAFLFFVYTFIGFIICELLDSNAWFDHLEIYDLGKKTIAVFIWPIIIVLLIVQLVVYCFPLIINFFTNTKKLFNEIKYATWLAGSLIYEICVKIFNR